MHNVFKYVGNEVRVVTIEGEPWFVAKDISDILGFRMASDMARTLDEDERGTHIIRTLGGSLEIEMIVISESGLYSAIRRSRRTLAYWTKV